MSAHLPASASRRKVTTYGKTAGRRVEGFNRENERPLSSTYNVTKPGNKDVNENLKRNQDSIRVQARQPEDANAVVVLQERQHADPQDKAQSSLVVARRDKEAAEFGKPGKTSDSAQQHDQGRAMESRRGGRGVDVFDVPTSDEDTTIRQPPKKSRSPGRIKHGRAQREQRPTLGKVQSSVVPKPSLTKQPSMVVRSMSASGVTTLPVRKLMSASSILQDRTLQQQISLQMSTEDTTMEGMDHEETPSAASMMASPESPARLRGSPQDPIAGIQEKPKPKSIKSKKQAKMEHTEKAARKPTKTIQTVANISTDDEIPRALKRRTPDIYGIDSTDEEHDQELNRTLPLSPLRTPSPRKRPRVLHKTSIPAARDDVDVDTDDKEHFITQTYSPRHAKLWGELLHGNNPPAPSPSAIPFERLGLTTTRTSRTDPGRPSSSALHFPDIDAAEPGNRKRRLIDALARRSISEDVDLETESESDGEGASSPTLQAVQLPTSSQITSQEEGLAISSSQTTAVDSTFDSHAASSQSAATSQSTGLKVTYSRQRSYLTEASLEEAILPSTSQEPSNRPGYATRRGASQRSLVPSMPMDVSMDDADDELGNSGSLRSIHELRAAGVNKRFLDEFEGMLEDIIHTDDGASSSLSRRRSSLLELALKLSKSHNARRFIELGLERRLFTAVGGTRDLITDFALASLVIILGREGLPSHSTTQICQPDTFQLLTELLGVDRDIVALGKDRKLNISRVSQSLLSDLVQVLRKSPAWPTLPDFISPRLIALSALEVVMSNLREAGSGGAGGDLSPTLPSNAATSIVAILSQTLDWSADQKSADHHHHHQPPHSIQKSLEIEMSLGFLEACTTRVNFAFGGPAEDMAWTQMITELLLYVCHRDGSPFQTSSLSQDRRIYSSVLRVFLNITNHRASSWSSASLGTAEVAVALTGVITSGFRPRDHHHHHEIDDDDGDEDENEDGSSVDDLILGLAALINLVESNPTMQAHMLEQRTVDGETNLLDALLRPFLLGLRKTSEVRFFNFNFHSSRSMMYYIP